jgi:ribosomal protein S18 acetylase RimI-like enzyme
MTATTPFALRRATRGDLEALLPLVQSYRVFYEQKPDAERERRFIEAHLADGSSVIYVAEANDHAIGFMQLFKTYSTVHLAPAWILEDLFVAPNYRGKGVAAALLERARQHALEDGACQMFLETAHDNQRAQRLYERAGWTREARFYKYNAPLS